MVARNEGKTVAGEVELFAGLVGLDGGEEVGELGAGGFDVVF